MTTYPEAFHAHQLELNRHFYRNAPHASLGELESWSAFTWKTSDHRSSLLIPRPRAGEYQIEQAVAFIETTGQGMKDWVVETANDRDGALERFLFKNNWVPSYQMPAFVFTKDQWEAWSCPVFPDDGTEYTVAIANTDEVRGHFAHVEGMAYETTYGISSEARASFWKNRDSICGPHAKGWVVYADGSPVYTVGLFIFEGVASIGTLAAVPEWRGKGLAYPVIWEAFGEAFNHGAEVGFGVTMPSGVKVAAGMGAKIMLNYTRWVANVTAS